MYFYIEVSDAPFQGILVGVEEDIEPVSPNGTAPVENFHGLSIIIAGDNHFCSEGVSLVGSHEDIAWLYFESRCGYAVGILAAAFWTRAISGYSHLYGLPFAGLFGGSYTSSVAFGIWFGTISRFVRGDAWLTWLGLSIHSRFAQGRLRVGP